MCSALFGAADLPKGLYNEVTLKYSLGIDMRGTIALKWRNGWRRQKRVNESELGKTQLSRDEKEILYFIRDENLAQKIPDRRDIIDSMNSIRTSTVGLKLESLKDKGLVFRIKILELIDHYGLDYLGYQNGRFHPPKELEWLEPYLNEIGGRRGDAMSWARKLEYSKQEKSFRHSYHYVALLEKDGRPCYEPLGLLLIIK